MTCRVLERLWETGANYTQGMEKKSTSFLVGDQNLVPSIRIRHPTLPVTPDSGHLTPSAGLLMCMNAHAHAHAHTLTHTHLKLCTMSVVLSPFSKSFLICSWSALCVFPAGQFGIPEGLVFSMPVKFENGTWVVLTDLEDISLTPQIINRLADDLVQVRQGTAKELVLIMLLTWFCRLRCACFSGFDLHHIPENHKAAKVWRIQQNACYASGFIIFSMLKMFVSNPEPKNFSVKE